MRKRTHTHTHPHTHAHTHTHTHTHTHNALEHPHQYGEKEPDVALWWSVHSWCDGVGSIPHGGHH